jgi:hypothetical protein
MDKKLEQEMKDLRKMFTPDVQKEMERKIMSFTMQRLKKPSGVNINNTKDRQGECYMLAGGFVLDNKGWSLCHGTLDPPTGPHAGTKYEHAWAENKTMVYESVFNTFYNKKDYYKVYLPNINKKFTTEQTRKSILSNETWGPW